MARWDNTKDLKELVVLKIIDNNTEKKKNNSM